MGKFRDVQVHFEDGGKSLIARTGSRTSIQAIFLNGSERRFIIKRKRSAKALAPTDQIPHGVRIVPKPKGTPRGPGKVCYLEDDVLKCWDPT